MLDVEEEEDDDVVDADAADNVIDTNDDGDDQQLEPVDEVNESQVLPSMNRMANHAKADYG